MISKLDTQLLAPTPTGRENTLSEAVPPFSEYFKIGLPKLDANTFLESVGPNQVILQKLELQDLADPARCWRVTFFNYLGEDSCALCVRLKRAEMMINKRICLSCS